MRIVYITGLFIFFFANSTQTSMVGTRNANPTYTRMPKVYLPPEVVVVRPVVTPQPILVTPALPITPVQGQYVENQQQLNPNTPPQGVPIQIIQTTPTQGQYVENQQQPNPNTSYQAAPAPIIQTQYPQQEELASYSHMLGTSDTYGGFDIR